MTDRQLLKRALPFALSLFVVGGIAGHLSVFLGGMWQEDRWAYFAWAVLGLVFAAIGVWAIACFLQCCWHFSVKWRAQRLYAYGVEYKVRNAHAQTAQFASATLAASAYVAGSVLMQTSGRAVGPAAFLLVLGSVPAVLHAIDCAWCPAVRVESETEREGEE